MVAVTACQLIPLPSKPASRPHSKPADTRAAQQFYDRGLQEYSRENYLEARRLFQRVIDLEPSAELKAKAQENLDKTQRILKTLENIKAK